MKSVLPSFIKLPNKWIEDGGLKQFKWRDNKSDETAALMVLAVLAHHIDLDDGSVQLTYTQICDRAFISRAKVAAGLGILIGRGIIESIPDRRSWYQLSDYDSTKNFAKLPAKALYARGHVSAFAEFRLRSRAELDALKLYFLFASRRNWKLNMAPISYEKINGYTGVPEHRIKPALNVLSVHPLIHIERYKSRKAENGIAHAYRLAFLDASRHMGTIGRDDDHALGLDVEPAFVDWDNE